MVRFILTVKCETKDGLLINLVFKDGSKYDASDKIVVSTILR